MQRALLLLTGNFKSAFALENVSETFNQQLLHENRYQLFRKRSQSSFHRRIVQGAFLDADSRQHASRYAHCFDCRLSLQSIACGQS